VTEGDDLGGLDPLSVSDRRVWVGLVRLVALFVILFVLPMLLLAATVHPEGCGGG
jgi:hypothetical protein